MGSVQVIVLVWVLAGRFVFPVWRWAAMICRGARQVRGARLAPGAVFFRNARDGSMRTMSMSLRAIFLVGFVIAMPILALPAVARRMDARRRTWLPFDKPSCATTGAFWRSWLHSSW